jgi:uncharacterized protein (TIGR03435 family)
MIATLFVIMALHAQSPAFEVASVKLNLSGERGLSISPPAGGRFKATNVPLGRLIETAYEVERFQISGGPKWLNDDRFDVEAMAQGNPGLGEMRSMLQSLLADRFKLAITRETRTVPVYALTIAKGGPKLSPPSDPGCKPPPAGSCGGIRITNRTSATGENASTQQIARVLTVMTSQRVVDKTGLTGVFNFKLQWTADENRIGEPVDTDAAPPEPGETSVFAALQDQLGLRLVSEKDPVEILVITHAQSPAEN